MRPAPASFPRRFAGRCVLVTGAASSIDAATAQRLAAEGANALVADIDAEGGADVGEAIR